MADRRSGTRKMVVTEACQDVIREIMKKERLCVMILLVIIHQTSHSVYFCVAFSCSYFSLLWFHGLLPHKNSIVTAKYHHAEREREYLYQRN